MKYIFISGFTCVGKSSIVRDIQDIYRSKGFNVIDLNESFKDYKLEILESDYIYFNNKNNDIKLLGKEKVSIKNIKIKPIKKSQ